MTSAPSPHRSLRLALFSLALLLGLLRALASRDIGGGDTLSYLDIADLYSRGEFSVAVSSFWSPLYSWLLASSLRVVRPGPETEYALNAAWIFVLYLFWLLCFLYFWRAADAWRAARANGDTGLSPFAWLLLGYDLFLWSALELRANAVNNPDQLMNGFVLLAAALLLRMHSGRREPWRFVAFGALLALGYLAKAALFPVALILLAALWWVPQSPLKPWRGLALALAAFLLFAGPWIVILSVRSGRLTFSETGRLNYAFHVNQVPYTNWQGEPPGTGSPAHVSRRLSDRPAVFEFADPGRGTYPLWFDPVRWNQGVEPHFDLRQQLRTLAFNAWLYLLLFASRADLLVVWPLLAWMGIRRGLLQRLRQGWFLWLPALAAMAMHAVVHFESRHVAVYLVLLWTAAFAALRFSSYPHVRRLATAGIIALALSTAISLGREFPEEIRRIRERPDRVYWEVAQELVRLGAEPGDRIALFGDALWNSSAARLARVQVAAEMPADQLGAYWSAAPERRTGIRDRLASAGIAYVIAECGDDCTLPCTRFPNTSTRPIRGPRTLAVCRLADLP
ncbi:MAG TPA: hypothetical protein VNK82_05570 [Terriglobales bacterium]|nr:hypothetical protein [Terriglobales bacterium]